MNSKTDALFLFIKTLSSAEKIRIKQYAGLQKGEKNYLRLYDVLCDMDEYDESYLREHFKGEKFLKNLSRLKNYLHGFLLKALSAFYTEPNADLSDMIREIHICVNKKSFAKALELIKKAKKTASERERFHEWLRLLNLERELILELPKIENFDERLDYLKAEIESVTQLLINLQHYINLEDDLLKRARRKFQIRGEKDKSIIDKLASSPLMQYERFALSSRARLKYLKNLGEISWLKQDIQNTISCTQKTIAIYEEHEYLIEEYRSDYQNDLVRLVNLFLRIDDHENSKIYLEKFDKRFTQASRDRGELFDKLLILKLSYSIDTGDETFGLEAVASAEKELALYESGIKDDLLILIYFLLTRFNIISGNNAVASRWVQKIIHTEKRHLRIDLQIFARVLHLVVLFESNDLAGIEYHARNYARFINKQDHVYKVESALVRFLNKTPDYIVRNNLMEGLEKLKVELSEILKDPYEQRALEYFDIIEWLDEKLESANSIIKRQ